MIKFEPYSAARIAEDLAYDAKIDLRYCSHLEEKWIYWDDSGDNPLHHKWVTNNSGMQVVYIMNFLRIVGQNARNDDSIGSPSKMLAVAYKMGTSAMINDVLRILSSLPGCYTPIEAWDACDNVINLKNGVCDLLAQTIRKRNKNDLFLKVSPFSPNKTAPKKWIKFLTECMGGDQESVDFLQRMCGFFLGGGIEPASIFFLYGDGGNGKTKFINVLLSLLGTGSCGYATTVHNSLFIETRQDNQHRNTLAVLDGRRLIVCSEFPPFSRFDKAKINSMSGGEDISANFMGKNTFTFTPKFKILLSSNDKLECSAIDYSTRRRMHLIPFNVRPKEPIMHLDEILLKEEGDSILFWMIQGFRLFKEKGLLPSDLIKSATDDYLSEGDDYGAWFSQCVERCDVGGDTIKRMFSSWKIYCEAYCLPIGKFSRFSNNIGKICKDKKRTSFGVVWSGYKLKYEANKEVENREFDFNYKGMKSGAL